MPVAFVTSSAISFSTGGSTTVTTALSAGTSPDRLVTAFGQGTSTAASGVTYAGSSLTLAGSNSVTRLYYKAGAASGTNNFVVTVGTYQQGVFAFASFSGVDGTSPIGSVASGSGISTSPATSSITLPTDGMIYGAVWTSYATSLSVSGASGTTLRSSVRNGGTGQQVGGGTRTSTGALAWSLASSIAWRALGFPINPVASAAVSDAPRRAFPQPILNF